MSQSQQSPDPTDSSIRPSSVWTNDSAFADSAISMGSRTPKHLEEMTMDSQPPPSSEHNISDRLSQLAASAWATEQGLPLDDVRLSRIQKALKEIEVCLNESEEPSAEASEDEDEARRPRMSSSPVELRKNDESEVEQEQLNQIHRNLRATVGSMRMRQQEQRHLNQLSLEKLETVAQTCFVQDNRLKEMKQEVRSLRVENHKLGEENDGLRDQIAGLESQAMQKEVAVNAMSSAVAGLEGWINSSPAPQLRGEGTTPVRQRRGEYVVRGKGRFRGRYYIDEPEEETVGAAGSIDGGSTSREIHDGVRAWLRGFRDVEEELQKPSPGKMRMIHRAHVDTNDDWGEFETVSES